MKLRIPRRIKTAELPVEEDSEQSDDAQNQDKDKVPVATTKSSTVSATVTKSGEIKQPKHPRQSQNIFQGWIRFEKKSENTITKSELESQQ